MLGGKLENEKKKRLSSSRHEKFFLGIQSHLQRNTNNEILDTIKNYA